jgi:asparagine synthase (glutamine-hydrolysing)
MCGIVGIASLNKEFTSRLYDANQLLIHRGPDASGLWRSRDENVALAHRRLSIVDLSSEANQPMVMNSNKNLVISFNGEIYNYQSLRKELKNYGHSFKTSSDTEVILASYEQWGEKCLEYFEGAFVFAIYDIIKRRLFIARDRTGEKPIFFSNTKKRFIFASEIKSLIEIDKNLRVIDSDGLTQYLSQGYVSKDHSILKDVQKLESGSYLTYSIDDYELIIKRYWQLKIKNNFYSDEKYISENIIKLLQESINNQLNADVPVGILLSGGVDSSLITALASNTNRDIKTYSIKFSNFKKYDESIYATKVSNFFGTDHNEIEASEVPLELLSRLAIGFDEPISDPSMIPTFLICEAVSKDIKVVLGGDGGDELFGGYNHYSRLMVLNAISKYLPVSLRKYLSSNLLNTLPIGTRGYNWIEAFGSDIRNEIPAISTKFNYRNQIKLIKKDYHYLISDNKVRKPTILDNEDFLINCLKNDFENYLTDNILVKVDRASMINSLEVRAPFLNHRLIEFVFNNVPSSYKANLLNKKIILKKLLGNIFPKDFDFERKQGLNAPIENWLLQKKWFNFFLEVLTDDSSLFDRKFILKILNDKKRYRQNSEKIFSLVMFELWRKNYNISI